MSAAAATRAANCCACCCFIPKSKSRRSPAAAKPGTTFTAVHPNLRGGDSACSSSTPTRCKPAMCCSWRCRTAQRSQEIERYAALAPTIIDLSADFRLNDPDAYQRWYGEAHPAPQWLEIRLWPAGTQPRQRCAARTTPAASAATRPHQSGAVAAGRRPAGWTRRRIEIKVGSSEGGNQPNAGSHHPVRSGAVRAYSPTGHRHMAEVQMMLGAEVPHAFRRDRRSRWCAACICWRTAI